MSPTLFAGRFAIACFSLLVMTTSGMADEGFSGDINFKAGLLDLDVQRGLGDGFSNGQVYGLGVRSMKEFDNFGLQADLNLERVRGTSRYAYTSYSGALHMFGTFSGLSLGGMLSFGNDEGWEERAIGGSPYTTTAIEAAYAFGALRFDIQLGRFEPDDKTTYIQRGRYGHLGIEWQFDPYWSVKFIADRGAMKFVNPYYLGSPYDYMKISGYGGEVKFNVSEDYILFGQYKKTRQTDDYADEIWHTRSVIVGLRMPFGSSSRKPVFEDRNPLTGVAPYRFNDWL